MHADKPIDGADPAILVLIGQPATRPYCSDEEAIGIAVSSELATRRAAIATVAAGASGQVADGR